MSSTRLVKLPGFIDIHVRTREPDSSNEEDFDSCTAAALAGGITMIFCSPNMRPPIVDEATLSKAKDIAQSKARCDYAIFIGASVQNTETVYELASESAGLKLYLDHVDKTSPLYIDDYDIWNQHMLNWPKTAPLIVQAERKSVSAAILLASFHNRPVHICRVTKRDELQLIKAAKERGLRITCEISPEYLFLSSKDLERFGISCSHVKPPLLSQEDQHALWENLHIVDCFTSLHSPTSLQEKSSQHPLPGYPGLETMLPLLLNAVCEGKLTIEDLISKFYSNPKKIFNLPDQPNTYVEVDLQQEWIIPEAMKYSRAKWTPFAGMKVKGAVQRVILRGEVVFEGGEVLAKPGYGEDVREWDHQIMHVDTSSTAKKPAYFGLLNIHGLAGKHIVDTEIFTKELLNYVFDIAQDFRAALSKQRQLDHVLKGKMLASVFFEPSTKGRCCYASAMYRLGGGVIYMDDITSSVKKGECVYDSVAMMASYADVIILRHPRTGCINKVAKNCKKPIINVGDGTGEHPTQALLDAFTIREELGTINGLKIAFVGDLKNSRTVHSLAKLLSMYEVRFRYISPKNLKMPDDVIEYVAARNISQNEHDTMEEILSDTDVLYMTRIQKERFVSHDEYEKSCGQFIITPQLMTKAKRRMIVLHPLPRLNELVREFDTDSRAAYFRQAEYGLYIRMAILAMVLGRV